MAGGSRSASREASPTPGGGGGGRSPQHQHHTHAHAHAHAVRKSIHDTSRRSSSRQSLGFQMFRAIECKEEFKKLRLAGFLHELQALAEEERQKELEEKGDGEKEKEEEVEVASTPEATAGDDDYKKDTDGCVTLLDVSTSTSFSYTDLSTITSTQAQSKIKEIIQSSRKNTNDEGKCDVAILGSKSFLALLNSAKYVLSKDETLIDLRQSEDESKVHAITTVVGDLHASLNCLSQVLELIEDVFVESDEENDDSNSIIRRRVVFDGDYVDRGANSLEVFSILLLLKLAYPQKVFMLRGNHEDTMTASIYGAKDEVDTKYPDDYTLQSKLWDAIGDVFAALPIIARTDSAIILHGGIPTEDFTLERVAEISSYARCQLPTTVNPEEGDEALIQGILWSDPSPDDTDGIIPSPRGAGVEFGPDILFEFLERYPGLKYIIRAHEPVEEGSQLWETITEDGRGVVTVFSTAAYPYGEGTNLGAVLELNEYNPNPEDGNEDQNDTSYYETLTFEYEVFEAEEEDESDEVDLEALKRQMMGASASSDDGEDETKEQEKEERKKKNDTKDNKKDDPYYDMLKSIVDENGPKLAKAFRKAAGEHSDDKRLVTVTEWVTIMSEELDLQEVPWVEMQPELLPVVETDEMSGTEYVEWQPFLNKYLSSSNQVTVSMINMDGLSADQLSLLQEHREKFLNIFKLLDVDESGTISEEEFLVGIDTLNRELPPGQRLFETSNTTSGSGDEENKGDGSGENNKEEKLKLFKQLDVDNSGDISIEEFSNALSQSAVLRNAADKLDENQIIGLKENHDILLLAFKYLDIDRSGAIDREEFQRGVDLLNSKMTSSGGRLVEDPEELFDLMDIDGDGEIDINEFNKMFKSLGI